jgi:hypothetical protein
MESRHVSVFIDRPADEVYRYAADPSHLSSWAAGLAEAEVKQVDGEWVSDSPIGRVVIAVAPPIEFGVLDHDVTLPSGETVNNPMRVVPAGTASEVVFSVQRRPEMSDDDFAADAAAVARDLATLRDVLEKSGLEIRP